MSIDARDNRIDYVEFRAADAEALGRTRAFYGTIFGWNYKEWGADYADTQSSGVSSGISVDASRQGRPLPVIYSTHLENVRASVLAAGAKLTKDIFSFPGGRRFQFTDPAGNELAVWSDR